MEERNIEQLDFVYVIGDAYVDHPSFGHAVISRVLEAHGYRVGIISQPDWKNDASITVLGKPRLAFLISAGNMDSMVNHYSVSKKRRSQDAYTPGGKAGMRPDYATVVYGNLIRKTYKDVPIIIGGIEASLRRMAHYDYWSNKFKRSVLLDSQADVISYGMGEKSIVELAEALDSGIAVSDITFIKGTVYKTKKPENIYDGIWLPDYDTMKENINEALREQFKPEFLNRLDDIIIFRKLTKEEAGQICKKIIEELTVRLRDRNVSLVVTESALSKLVEEGYNDMYGARPLKRTIQRRIEDRLSDEILAGKVLSGETVTVDVKDGDLTFRSDKN